MTNKKIYGSVLVVGGGIFGMQSALDLARSGFLVHLIEKRKAIGGLLAQRDKPFPDDNCALCTMSPLLIEVMRNENIELITEAEIIDLSGEPGNYKVKISQKLTYLENNRVNYCHACLGVPQADDSDEKRDLRCNLAIDSKDLAKSKQIEEEQFIELQVGAVILSNRQDIQLVKSFEVGLSNDICDLTSLVNQPKLQGGIFACGACYHPKDIAETVVEAGAAAAYVSMLLATARGTMLRKKKFLLERDTHQEKPRLGVLVCNGGKSISSVVNIPQIMEYVSNLKNVVYVQDYSYLCASDSKEKIKSAIDENNLNRVVIAACSPITHGALFQDCLQEVGLNKYMYEQANIREQVAWVHRDIPWKATQKAKDLIRMAVAKVRLQDAAQTTQFHMKPRALIVGGGLAGMVSSLALAEQGYEVVLIEKTDKLGGQTGDLKYTLTGQDPVTIIRDLQGRIDLHPNIEVVINAELQKVSGHIGNYRTVIKLVDNSVLEVIHGVIILAVGAKAVKPIDYLYGKYPLVVTQQELEQSLTLLQLNNLQTIVMIQCTESRDEGRSYCSKICCTQAIKNALKIKELSPKTDVIMLFRDVGDQGFKEKYYYMAKQKGIRLIRYNVKSKPQVTPNYSTVSLQVNDDITGQTIALAADLLVLSSGIETRENNRFLSDLIKIPLNKDGFFLISDTRFRPLDLVTEGIYQCGMVNTSTGIEESIGQAFAASIRAVNFLSRSSIESLSVTAMVDEEMCRGCGLCITSCPYNARILNNYRKVAYVNEALCRGCGNCSSVCPSGATQQKGYQKEQLLSMIDAALDL